MRFDSHVQAWTRDRVRVLELLAELRKLQDRETKLEEKFVMQLHLTRENEEGVRVVYRTVEVRSK